MAFRGRGRYRSQAMPPQTYTLETTGDQSSDYYSGVGTASGDSNPVSTEPEITDWGLENETRIAQEAIDAFNAVKNFQKEHPTKPVPQELNDRRKATGKLYDVRKHMNVRAIPESDAKAKDDDEFDDGNGCYTIPSVISISQYEYKTVPPPECLLETMQYFLLEINRRGAFHGQHNTKLNAFQNKFNVKVEAQTENINWKLFIMTGSDENKEKAFDDLRNDFGKDSIKLVSTEACFHCYDEDHIESNCRKCYYCFDENHGHKNCPHKNKIIKKSISIYTPVEPRPQALTTQIQHERLNEFNHSSWPWRSYMTEYDWYASFWKPLEKSSLTSEYSRKKYDRLKLRMSQNLMSIDVEGACGYELDSFYKPIVDKNGKPKGYNYAIQVIIHQYFNGLGAQWVYLTCINNTGNNKLNRMLGWKHGVSYQKVLLGESPEHVRNRILEICSGNTLVFKGLSSDLLMLEMTKKDFQNANVKVIDLSECLPDRGGTASLKDLAMCFLSLPIQEDDKHNIEIDSRSTLRVYREIKQYRAEYTRERNQIIAQTLANGLQKEDAPLNKIFPKPTREYVINTAARKRQEHEIKRRQQIADEKRERERKARQQST